MSSRIHAEAKSSSTPVAGFKVERLHLLHPHEVEQAEPETASLDHENKLSTSDQPNPLPPPPPINHHFGQVSVQARRSPTIQYKLAIGQPGDKYEQEADRVADQVMRMPEPGSVAWRISHPGQVPAVQRVCTECQDDIQRQSLAGQKENEDESKHIQAKQKPGHAPQVFTTLETQLNASKRKGQQISEDTRRFMESRFRYDFSTIRIHTGSNAIQLSQKLQAQAFTYGSDIYFNAGKYNPTSYDGKHLLAHELAHAVQQTNNNRTPQLQRVPIGENITMNTLPNAPPRVELYGPYRDSAIAQELYGDPTVPINHSSNDYSIVYVNYSRLLDRWKPAFASAREELSSDQQQEENRQSQSPEVGEPVEPGEHVISVVLDDGSLLNLSDNEEHIKYQLKSLVARQGRSVLPSVTYRLGEGLSQFERPGSPSYKAPWNPIPSRRSLSPEDEFRLQKGREILALTRRVIDSLNQEFDDFLSRFNTQLEANTIAVLNANEQRTRSEMVRYGITWREEEHSLPVFEPQDRFQRTVTLTRYEMAENLPSAAGLQQAAHILLQRREAINSKEREFINEYTLERDCREKPCGWIMVLGPRHEALQTELNELKQNYQNLLQVIGQEYPVLAYFGSLDQDIRNLTSIANQPPGQTTARIVGQRIKEQIENIQQVRDNIGDVNFWRLNRVVGLTKTQFGIVEDSLQGKLVDEKVENEQPGILQSLALLVMNIAALLLAPATGGLSLAVAAGVNIAVAVHDVQDYLLQEALANTDFDRARALSQEEPSLFWLAVSLVGVIPDIGDAARAFRSISRAIRGTRAARTAREIAEAEELIRAIGRQHGLEDDLIETIVRRAKNRDESLRALGVSAEKIDEFRRAARVADDEAARATATAVNTAINGEVKVSQGGLIFSCTSPCTVMREKYAEQLANNSSLTDELSRLEAEAAQASTDNARQSIAERAALLEARIRNVPLRTWRSPLADSPEFENLLRRRGSAAPELDRKPSGWTGQMEARFRYGNATNPEDGYRWVLDQNGTLRYDRLDDNLPRRYFDPESGQFRNLPPSTVSVALESEEELARLAHLGREATSRADWLNRIRRGIPTLQNLSDDALNRVFALSPNIDHMKGQLLEELAGGLLANRLRTRTAGRGLEFIPGHQIRDAAGRQLTDGMLVRRRSNGTLEVVAIIESKAGSASAQGLRKSYKRFSELSTDDLNELRGEAIEEIRLRNGLDPEASILPDWAETENLMRTHRNEIEARMREIHTHDMGQFERDFERLMPSVEEESTTIFINGTLTEVRASRRTTRVIGVAPSDVSLNKTFQYLQGISAEALDVGLTSDELIQLTRQLRAEFLQNGSQLIN